MAPINAEETSKTMRDALGRGLHVALGGDGSEILDPSDHPELSAYLMNGVIERACKTNPQHGD